MPFVSRAEERFLYAKHPEIAKRWASETPDIKSLPEKKRKGLSEGLRDGK